MTYLSTVKARTPLHYYRLAESEGEIIHDVGSGNYHLLNDAVPVHLGYTGIAADGGSFRQPNAPGIANGIALPTFTSPATLEAWVWVPGYFGFPQTIMDIGDMSIQFNGATLNPQFYVNPTNLNAPAAITPQRWHHIVGTYDEITQRLYVDGVQVASVANTRRANQTWIRIGAYPDKTRIINAWICECAIYTGALLASAVAGNYAAQETTSPPVFRGQIASIDLSTGTGPTNSQNLTDVLNSVRKTY